jgi:hypothetical protein
MLEREGLIAEKTTESNGETTSKTFIVPRHAIRIKPKNKAIAFGGSRKKSADEPKGEIPKGFRR